MPLSLALNASAPCITSSRSFAARKGRRTVRCEAERSIPAEVINRNLVRDTNAHSGFPPGFYFGAASAAYQVEGGTTVGGRGPSIWDAFCENFPEKIADRSNGDPGAGSLYYYQKDVDLLSDLGANIYRFSISWSRILPTGHGEPNPEGIRYYNHLIDALLAKGIQPFITIFHWDGPQQLDDEYGGFLSHKIVDDFKHFADICFKNFGDRVKFWLTLNEPSTFVVGGYSLGVFAPGRCTPNIGCPAGNSLTEPYIVAHNLLLAHAEVVKLYRDRYQAKQGGKIGITLVTNWFVPYTNSPQNLDAQKRALEFNLGWFMDPIKFGDYPFSMKSLVEERLPQFTKEESKKLKNSYDFLGLNYYTSSYAKTKGFELDYQPKVCGDDMRVDTPDSKNGVPIGYVENQSWVYVYPRGLKELLLYIKQRYNNPDVFITENGVMRAVDDSNFHSIKEPKKVDEHEDIFRAQYQAIHLHELEEALRQGVKLKGYFVWSLLDSFEWRSGYTNKFGLTFVNNGPFKPIKEIVREPKDSFQWYKWFISIAKTPRLLKDGSPAPFLEDEDEPREQHYEEEEEVEVTADISVAPTKVTVGF